MSSSPSRPDGTEPDANAPQIGGGLARIDPPESKPLAETQEEERLVGFFERMMVRHEEVEGGPPLSPEQVTLALQQQEEERKRSHERMLSRDKQRHEVVLAKQREESERRQRQFELRKAKLTFLPKIAVGFGAIVLLGTALILYLLVSNNAKDQIPVVLAFLSGVVGGILAGFGGGFAAAKLFPTAISDQAPKK